MKTVLIAALLLLATSFVGARLQMKPSATKIAIDKLRLEMPGPLAELTSLDASDKALERSNIAQADTSGMLEKTRLRIEGVDLPELKTKFDAHDEKVARYIASGCPPEGGIMPPAVADRCNRERIPLNDEITALLRRKADLEQQLSAIAETRAAVTATTLSNFAKQKANAARREDLEALKLAQASRLRQLYLTGIREVVSRLDLKPQALAACEALPSLEESVCCQQVVVDERNPAQCNVPLIVTAFEKAGIFGSTIVK
jgi:hypothetical protein